MGARPRRLLGALVPLLLAALAVAGCTRPALSRQDYRARVTHYCVQAQAAQRALPSATDRGTLLTRLRRLRAINRRLTNRIAQLNPPIGTDRSHDSAINVGLRTDRVLGQVTRALRTSPDPAAELARRRPELARLALADSHRWAQLRLKRCVGGPSQALADVRAPKA
jgi:hypothetical protein